MAVEELNALAPLQSLIDQIVKEDLQKIEENYEKQQRNLHALFKIVMTRQILEKKEEFVKKLIETSKAVGDCLSLAAKYRYPLINREEPSFAPNIERQRYPQPQNPQPPVVVQSQPAQGFWTGFFNLRIAHVVEKLQRPEEKVSEKPVAHTARVVDEIRALEEVRPLLNQIIELTFKCIRRYDTYPNPYIKKYLHIRVEEELPKVGITLLGAARWAALVQKTETRQVAGSLATFSARVAEAQAMRPVFASEAPITAEQLTEVLTRLRMRGIDLDDELKRRGI